MGAGTNLGAGPEQPGPVGPDVVSAQLEQARQVWHDAAAQCHEVRYRYQQAAIDIAEAAATHPLALPDAGLITRYVTTGDELTQAEQIFDSRWADYHRLLVQWSQVGEQGRGAPGPGCPVRPLP